MTAEFIYRQFIEADDQTVYYTQHRKQKRFMSQAEADAMVGAGTGVIKQRAARYTYNHGYGRLVAETYATRLDADKAAISRTRQSNGAAFYTAIFIDNAWRLRLLDRR